MKQNLTFIVLLSFLTFSACHQRPNMGSDDDKIIYSMGVDMGAKLKTFQLSDKERSIFKMGIDDGVSNKKPQVEPREFLAKLGQMVQNRQKSFAEKEKKEAKSFLENAAKKEKAEKTESGLIYIPTKEGEGKSPKVSDRVKVHYHGTLRSGEVFDSSKERNQPATFRLDGLMKCWKEGVQKMKVGGQAELYCPSELAYGDRGAPPKILPGAVLKFEVELLEILDKDDKDVTSSHEGHKHSKESEKEKKEASSRKKEEPKKETKTKEKSEEKDSKESK